MRLLLYTNRRRKILFLFILILILLLVSLNYYRTNLQGFIYSFSSSFQKILWNAGQNVYSFFQGFLYATLLQQENQRLRNETQKLLSEIATLSEIRKENELLRKALDIGLRNDFKLIFSEVVAKDVSGDYLIINKGLKDGIKKNVPAITEQKALIGKVEEVYEKSAKIQLLSAKKMSFESRAVNSNIKGLIKGMGNFKVLFDLVPQYEEIEEGEVLVTSPTGGIFPAGLLVGVVKNVRRSDVEPFQYIEVNPSFDVHNLDYLFLIGER